MKFPSMTKLGELNSSDKVFHKYTELYEELFAPIRYLSVRILEIGYARGRGTRMLAEYFPRAIIHSFDIDPDRKSYGNLTKELQGRIKIYQGDQSNPDSIQNVLQQVYNGPKNADKRGHRQFDIIIDDGSHLPEHQQISFKKLWPEVKVEGLYIIEDFHVHYREKKHKTIDWLFNMIHELNCYGNKYAESTLDIKTITFARNEVIITKSNRYDYGRS